MRSLLRAAGAVLLAAACAPTLTNGFTYNKVFDLKPRALAPGRPARDCRVVIVCTAHCPFCSAAARTAPPEWLWLIVGNQSDAADFAEKHGLIPSSVDWLEAKGKRGGMEQLHLNATPTSVVLDSNDLVREIRVGADIQQAEADSICSRPGTVPHGTLLPVPDSASGVLTNPVKLSRLALGHMPRQHGPRSLPLGR